jgi:hypothetical protein
MINKLPLFILATAVVFLALKCGTSNQQIQATDTEASTNDDPWASTYNAPFIYKSKCATCHTLTRDVGSGPSLKNEMEKVPNEEWLYRFVTNEDSLIERKDPYTLEVNKWSNNVHFTHRFTTISRLQMDSIVDFLK